MGGKSSRTIKLPSVQFTWMLGVTAALGSIRALEKQRMELPPDEVTKPLREAQEVVLDWAEL